MTKYSLINPNFVTTSSFEIKVCQMFDRIIFTELEKWLTKSNRKPLVIRGARQVGKTTVVGQFSKKFKQYIYLNLELAVDRKPFEEFTTTELLVQSLFFIKNQSLTQRNEECK